MRAVLPLAALALIGACGGTDDQAASRIAAGNRTQPASREDEAKEQQDKIVKIAEGRAAAAPFDWTGTYAATPALCKGGRWRFSRAEVVTDGETSCRIGDVKEGDGHATLRLACVAEGTETDETWTLTRTGPNGFRVDRDTGAQTVSVNLEKCG